MRIAEILEHQRPVFSFEFFPPEDRRGPATLGATLEVLKDDEPDYVSVTYGAGGTTRDAHRRDRRSGSRRTSASRRWRTCPASASRASGWSRSSSEIQAAGIENVLALRGDPPRGETEWTPHPDGLSYSVELIRLIRERFDFCVGAACFPEVHPEAPDRDSDLRYAQREGRRRAPSS